VFYKFSIAFLNLENLCRLVPQPVMFGFINGLAVIIFMSQLINLCASSQRAKYMAASGTHSLWRD
jgi:MFS superfamily sulfate permease-like transporter